jgi:ATPase subunit of ABC transporter with duplicated ATPase domains
MCIRDSRYFLDQVVDRILVVETGKVVSHPGGYSDWLSSTKPAPGSQNKQLAGDKNG